MSERVSIVDNQQKQGACPFNHGKMSEAEIAQLKPLPGSQGLPLIGHTAKLAINPAQFSKTMKEKYGLPHYANVLGSNMIYFEDNEAVSWIFAGENKYLENSWTGPISKLLGQDCVSMLTGDAHRARRSVLNPHFRYEKMDTFVPVIRQTIDNHLEKWTNQGDLTLSMANRDLTFEIIAQYIFGEIDGLPMSKLRDDFQKWTGGFISMGIDLPFMPFGQAMRANKHMRRYLADIVEDYRQKDLPDCVIKTLIKLTDENGDPLPLDTIIDEIQIFLFAGHDTLVSALTNIMVLLAQHPGVVERACREQVETVEDNLTNSRGLKNYPYLDAIINEGLRLYPPAAQSFRKMKEDRCLDGYHLPKDWVMVVPIGAVMRNPDLWDKPDQFDPERFIRDEHKTHQMMHIPFGGGPRHCIGQNFAMIVLRLTLALLVKNYSWELKPGQNLEVSTLPTPLPKSGGLVTFRRLG